MKDKRLFRTNFRYLFLAISFSCLIVTGCGGNGAPATSAPPTAATPTLNPGTGTYISAQTVTIADATTGATIYYTLDGTAPSTSSARFTAPLSISSTTTVNAIAVAAGYNTSTVASATYTVNLPAAATPTFSVTAGTYTAVQIVTLSDATSGAAIYYTLDGTTPTISSAKYASPLSISSTTTVNAIAVASGYTNSAVASVLYTINLPAAATPTFSPAPGTSATAQTVTLADTTASSIIYYTTDGSTPTISSTRYTVPFAVSTTSTVKAIAVAPGLGTSAVASGTYTITVVTTSVSVVLSTHDQLLLMAPQSPVAFGTNAASTDYPSCV